MSNHRFSVPFEFPVYFTREAWSDGNPVLVDALRRLEPERRHRLLVVLDADLVNAQPELLDQIAAYTRTHSASLELVAPPLTVLSGEAVKNDTAHVFELLERLNELRLDRQSFVLVMGGGAVLDMVSFAAAIAHRGIRVVRMPTTVLAQGDSGIAVKNSVNLFGKKNFIGTFVPPFAVINDTATLDTLSLRDKIAGVSEAVKVSLLRSVPLFRYLEANAAKIAVGDSDVLAVIVERSAELHLEHICGNGDPFELGSARPLDFGHWAAHKLESMTSHRLRHGEAVAIGMALDVIYAMRQRHLDQASGERILRLLESIGFVLWDDALAERTPGGGYVLLDGLREFREHLGGILHITLLHGIGSSFEVTEMEDAVIVSALDALRCRAATRVAQSVGASGAA